MAQPEGGPPKTILDDILGLTIQGHLARAENLKLEGRQAIEDRDATTAQALYEAAAREEARGSIAEFLLRNLDTDLRRAGVVLPATSTFLATRAESFVTSVDSPAPIVVTTNDRVPPPQPAGSSAEASSHIEPSVPTDPVLPAPTWPTQEFLKADRAFRGLFDEGSTFHPGNRGGLGYYEARMALVALSLNGTRDAYEYPKWDDMWKMAFTDKLTILDHKALPEDERDKVLGNIEGQAITTRGVLRKKLEIVLQPDAIGVSPRMSLLVDWINSQPEFATLTPQQLAGVIYRKTPFIFLVPTSMEATETPIPPLPSPASPDTGALDEIFKPAWPTAEFLSANRSFVEMLQEDERSGGNPRGIGHSQARILAAGLALNTERSAFIYQSWNEIWKAADAKRITNINEGGLDNEEKQRKIALLGIQSSVVRSNLIAALEEAYQGDVRVHPRVELTVRWIKSQPEFAQLTAQQLSEVIRRKGDFRSVLRKSLISIITSPTDVPVTPDGEFIEVNHQEALSRNEAFLLARVLIAAPADQRVNLGLRVIDSDIPKFEGIVTQLEPESEAGLRRNGTVPSLRKKLTRWVTDPYSKRAALRVNRDNQAATRLVGSLYFLNNVQQVEEILTLADTILTREQT